MNKQIKCNIVGVGALGPGFSNWLELKQVFSGERKVDGAETVSPKPSVIPANERRRAPLPVKMAVEVSSQALEQSGFESSEVACVFGSGISDTDITDYMCRVLTTDLKQLSPTKFHNSVHNAAAGYWTISTGCMKSANSVAAFNETAAACLVEAMIHCDQENEPVLMTLFDIKAHSAFRDVFDCEDGFAAAVLICPEGYAVPEKVQANLCLYEVSSELKETSPLKTLALKPLYSTNPSAKVLPLLEALFAFQSDASIHEQIVYQKLSQASSSVLKID